MQPPQLELIFLGIGMILYGTWASFKIRWHESHDSPTERAPPDTVREAPSWLNNPSRTGKCAGYVIHI